MDSKTDIQCPACNSIFTIAVSKIPEKGCHANCKKCKERILITRPPQSSGISESASAKQGQPAPAAQPAKKAPSADSAPNAEATPAVSAPAEDMSIYNSTIFEDDLPPERAPSEEWTLDGGTIFEEEISAESEPTSQWTVDGSSSIEELSFDDSIPIKKKPSAGLPAMSEETAADIAAMAGTASTDNKSGKENSPAPIAKPVQNKKKNSLRTIGLVGLILLVCTGAVFFLMQKFDFQITTKNSNQISPNETVQKTTPPAEVSQNTATAAEGNETSSTAGKTGVDIGDLFNQVNPAVATVLTYDSGNNIFMQGSGFFISRDGDFITNYHVLKGAYYVVIKTHSDLEYRAEFVLAANEQKDLIKLAVNIPDSNLQPGEWLEIDPAPPNIADKIIVIGTPMGLGRTVSDGIISAIREIPDRGLTFQMTAPISKGSSGSPVIDMTGKVVCVAFLQIVNGQNLNFAIPSDNILNLADKRPQTIAQWTEEINREKNETIDNLQKEIVKHIKHGNTDDKIKTDKPPQPTNEILKAKLAAEIAQESGIVRQNNSLTEAVLSSFEEKYEETGASNETTDDQKLSRFKDVIRLATDPTRINNYIKSHLASSLSIAELKEVLKWYKSPLGKKISGLEYSTYAVKKKQANKLRLAFNLTRYQSATRADLFARLDEATGSTESMVELQTNLIVQNQILDMVLSNSKELDQASINKIIKTFKSDIDPYLDIFAAQLVFAGFVYTYRELSEAELEGFLSFSETEAAKNYYSTLHKKSNTALLDCNRKILTSIVRVMNADSWENIRQDLNKPIKDA